MTKTTRTLPPGAIVHPIWLIRFFPLLGLIMVAAAMFFSGNATLRSMCLGGALGILVGATVFAWQVQDVTLKSNDQPSDVERYSLN